MRHPHYENHQRIIEHLVYDSIVTDPNPPKTPQFSLERTPRKRLLRETVNSLYDSNAIVPLDACQLLGCAVLNPNRVDHA